LEGEAGLGRELLAVAGGGVFFSLEHIPLPKRVPVLALGAGRDVWRGERLWQLVQQAHMGHRGAAVLGAHDGPVGGFLAAEEVAETKRSGRHNEGGGRETGGVIHVDAHFAVFVHRVFELGDERRAELTADVFYFFRFEYSVE
jgi:hypothetical protein